MLVGLRPPIPPRPSPEPKWNPLPEVVENWRDPPPSWEAWAAERKADEPPILPPSPNR